MLVRGSSANMGTKGGSMHIVVLSLVVAIFVCALVLAAFGVFTTTSLARRIEERERRDLSRLAR
jgi:hypothetical protein